MAKSTHSGTRITIAAIILLALASAITPVWAVTLVEEVDLGKKLDVEILKETPLSTDSQAQKEMDEYGQLLAKNVRRPEIKYHFQILEQDDFNAFSTPGGYVYFSQRLWEVLRKDERIGVLAHEIVHVDRRHALDAMLKAQRRQIWLAVLLTAVRANETWGSIADLAHTAYTLKYSRGDERQADEVGVELCQKAKFDPVGLLLAMRKIGRFQNEQGGQPPKIFASHPPTKERLQYIEDLLTKLGIAIPPENIKEVANPYKIGEVTSVDRDKVEFNSSKTVDRDSVVWMMGYGWDSRYENHTQVPKARGIVTREGPNYAATIWNLPGVKSGAVAKGTGVYSPPAPKLETGVGEIRATTYAAGDTGKLTAKDELKRLDRLMARQVAWNKDRTQLAYQNVGYVVLTSTAAEGRYLALQNPDFAYAPIAAGSILTRLNDPDQKRWVGSIVAIGRNGQTIDLVTSRTTEQLRKYQAAGTRFDVVYPQFDSKESYRQRVAGQAVVKSPEGKITLQMISYNPGWNISSIQNGFDVYDEVALKEKPTEEKN